MAWRILVICFWGVFHGLMIIINHLYRKATQIKILHFCYAVFTGLLQC